VTSARYLVLAVDYDGTLATDGSVADTVLAALGTIRESGRKLVLVTGRTLDDLRQHFERMQVFDRVVAENGAVIFRPETGDERVLSDPPPEEFVSALRARGVEPLLTGRVLIATREPHEMPALEVIRDMGLELQVIFNKGAVMILPTGVNKGSGLLTALDELGLSPHNAVGIGDAENDHAFLLACECAVAVANALPAIKRRADIVTKAAQGAGVVELIDRVLEDDLASFEPRSKRHRVVLGRRASSHKPIALSPFGTGLLVAGSSKAGKSSFVLGLVERIQEHGYQFCLIDPEGDYEQLPGAVGLGDTRKAPEPGDVIAVLQKPAQNVCVSLLGVPGEQRPAYFGHLLQALEDLRIATGRPHWFIIDEAQHVLPQQDGTAIGSVSVEFASVVLVTLDPRRINTGVLQRVTDVVAVGKLPGALLAVSAELCGESPPQPREFRLRKGQALIWQRRKKRAHLVELMSPSIKRRRHRRKYTEGELPDERSFYFRGPDGALNLRASNLNTFVELASGVDDATWQHHLQAGDYSRWIDGSIKDPKLARSVARVERSVRPPNDTRTEIRELIEERYAPPG
jgi:hydroxymethylpyrimidine pyrophosphatase-like HAD family hydrolase